MNFPPVQVQGVATLEEPICSTKRDHSSIQSKVANPLDPKAFNSPLWAMALWDGFWIFGLVFIALPIYLAIKVPLVFFSTLREISKQDKQIRDSFKKK